WTSADRAYVASERDREVIALKIVGAKIQVGRRIPVPGQPVALASNRAGSRLYAALATTARVAVIDATRNALIESIDATAPKVIYPNTQRLGGANSNALALSSDERTLLVSNGGENAVAVIRLSERAVGIRPGNRKSNDDDDGGEAQA